MEAVPGRSSTLNKRSHLEGHLPQVQPVSRGTSIWTLAASLQTELYSCTWIIQENPNLDSTINFLQQTENIILSFPPEAPKQQLPFELRGTVPVPGGLRRSGEEGPYPLS